MSNNLTLSDAINEALDTGEDATFVYDGTLYTFSAAGLLAFIAAEATPVDLSDYAKKTDLDAYAETTDLDARLSGAQRTAIDALTSESDAAAIVAALQAT